MSDEKLIAEAGRRLAEAAPDARVILFGSHARGDAEPSETAVSSPELEPSQLAAILARKATEDAVALREFEGRYSPARASTGGRVGAWARRTLDNDTQETG